jgi:serine/threonine protein kinase
MADHPSTSSHLLRTASVERVAQLISAQTPLTQVGHYKLIRALGQGGMGTVFLAEQAEPIRRQVALKLVRSGLNNQQIIERFESERQILARLEHPHIAHVYDAGATDEGFPFFAMEYVPGVPLIRFCNDNRLTIRERLQLFLQVCQAISFAHTKAVIHRDIKPGNILAATMDHKPVAKIIDFGIAKTLDPLLQDRFHTSEGTAIGTYEFMSPEQVQGSADIDTRTDVYSLGVVLYELLCGRHPLDTHNLRTRSEQEIKRLIRDVEPERPSTRLMRSQPLSAEFDPEKIAKDRQSKPAALSRELARELEWIPLMAMRKERQRRYASVDLLAQDIQRYLDSMPLIAGPESAVYRGRKFLRRHRIPIIATACVAIAGVMTTMLYIQSIRSAERRATEALTEAQLQTRLANESRARAETALKAASSSREFLASLLGAADPTSGKIPTVREVLDLGSQRLSEQADTLDVLTQGQTFFVIGRSYFNLGANDEAVTHLRQARRLLEASPDASEELRIDCRQLLAYALGRSNRPNDYNESRTILQQVYSDYRQLLGPTHRKTMVAKGDITLNRNSRANADPTGVTINPKHRLLEPWVVAARAYFSKHYGREVAEDEVFTRFDQLCKNINNALPQPGLRHTDQLIAEFAEPFLNDPGSRNHVPIACGNIGRVQLELGDVRAAEGFFHYSITSAESLFAPNAMITSSLKVTFADFYFEQDRDADALAILERAFDAIDPKAIDQDVSYGLRLRARLYANQQRFDDASRSLDNLAARIPLERFWSDYHADLAFARAGLISQQGNTTQALDLMESTLQRQPFHSFSPQLHARRWRTFIQLASKSNDRVRVRQHINTFQGIFAAANEQAYLNRVMKWLDAPTTQPR